MEGIPAGLPSGGDKSAVLAPPPKARPSRKLFEAFGSFVESPGSREIAAEDVGTDRTCMEWMMRTTQFVTGSRRKVMSSGDPGQWTALGVREDIRGRMVVPPDRILLEEAGVFSPCALGSAIGDGEIHRIRCRIVAGAANNQSVDPVRHCRMLDGRGIAYVPDFLRAGT